MNQHTELKTQLANIWRKVQCRHATVSDEQRDEIKKTTGKADETCGGLNAMEKEHTGAHSLHTWPTHNLQPSERGILAWPVEGSEGGTAHQYRLQHPCLDSLPCCLLRRPDLRRLPPRRHHHWRRHPHRCCLLCCLHRRMVGEKCFSRRPLRFCRRGRGGGRVCVHVSVCVHASVCVCVCASDCQLEGMSVAITTEMRCIRSSFMTLIHTAKTDPTLSIADRK